ncbi:MAG: hypothetical protein KAX50_10500 [Saprospiraceae bacterium]|nr:hypothetical protein [Saprospiraceae bacterium]
MEQKPFSKPTGIPGSAAGTPFRTLTAVLRSIASELLDYPDVIAQIEAFLGVFSPQAPTAPSDRMLRQLLLQHLRDSQKEKLSTLMTILSGMKTLKQEYGLDGAQQMDSYMVDHKTRFEDLFSGSKPSAISGQTGKISG